MVHRPNVDNRLCFVLMPFSDPFNGYYSYIIKPAIEAAGMKCWRADEIYGAVIIRDIWNAIWRAGVIVADVTNRNPNVNYELGLSHALGVSTILLTQSMDDVPFDYRYRRCIVYRTQQAKWEEQLSKSITTALSTQNSSDHVDSLLTWPYKPVPASNDVPKIVETIISHLEQQQVGRESNDGSGMWLTPPRPRDREVEGLADIARVLKRYAETEVDRSSLMRAEWLIARARLEDSTSLSDGARGVLSDAKTVLNELLHRLIYK